MFTVGKYPHTSYWSEGTPKAKIRKYTWSGSRPLGMHELGDTIQSVASAGRNACSAVLGQHWPYSFWKFDKLGNRYIKGFYTLRRTLTMTELWTYQVTNITRTTISTRTYQQRTIPMHNGFSDRSIHVSSACRIRTVPVLSVVVTHLCFRMRHTHQGKWIFILRKLFLIPIRWLSDEEERENNNISRSWHLFWVHNALKKSKFNGKYCL